MNKDSLITFGGAVAMALLVFGGGLLLLGSNEHTPAASKLEPEILPEESEAQKEKSEEPQHKDDKAPKEKAKEPEKLNPAEVAEALKQFEEQYNELYARSNFEDARLIALKASTLTHRDDPLWARRTADATYMSEFLPLQLRAQKALDIYSALLASTSTDADKHWAQYRVAQCLRYLGRWEDSMHAIEAFTKTYPDSELLPELRLYRAQALAALGFRDEGQQEVEKIIKAPASRDVHALAFVELAQMTLERAKQDSASAESNNAKAEVIDLSRYPTDLPEPAITSTRAQTATDLPDDQWQCIRRAIEKGNIKEAARLLDPWITAESTLSEEQRAKVSIKYANMVREMAQSNQPEIQK